MSNNYKYTCTNCGKYFYIYSGRVLTSNGDITCSVCGSIEFKVETSNDVPFEKESLSAKIEPAPVMVDRKPVWESIIEFYRDYLGLQFENKDEIVSLMVDRNDFGFKKYGVYLTAYNGRSPLVDLLQEKLDSLAYLQASIEEGLDSNGILERQLTDGLIELEEIYLLIKAKGKEE